MESALRQSERRLALAATAADLGLWSWNFSNQKIWATDRTRTMFGLTPDAVLTADAFLALIHADSRANVDAAIADAIAHRRHYACEFRIIRPDGDVRWISARGEPMFDESGTATTMTGIVHDITQRRTTELETLALRRDLAHAARVTLLGQLSSALAHELSQPLGAILRNAEAAELLLQEAVPDIEELRAIVTDIRRDDERAANVINRLRSLLKRRNLELVSIDLASLISEVVALVMQEALARDVRLHVDIPAPLPECLGDRVHLQQVLLNLIINAMDALHRAKPENRLIVIGAQRSGPHEMEVQVRDHGPGIPDAYLASLFEPFFTTKVEGMGMGLPVSKTIIDAHRGRIWAENHPGGGALFRFTISIAEDGNAA